MEFVHTHGHPPACENLPAFILPLVLIVRDNLYWLILTSARLSGWNSGKNGATRSGCFWVPLAWHKTSSQQIEFLKKGIGDNVSRTFWDCLVPESSTLLGIGHMWSTCVLWILKRPTGLRWYVHTSSLCRDGLYMSNTGVCVYSRKGRWLSPEPTFPLLYSLKCITWPRESGETGVALAS